MKTIKQFIEEKEDNEVLCPMCKAPTKDLSKIKISTTNHGHRYKSGRPWRTNYNIQCCQACFDSLCEQIEEMKPKLQEKS